MKFNFLVPTQFSEEPFLEAFSQKIPEGVHVILQLDNATYHKGELVNSFKNITLYYQPPYSPEYNFMERIWEYLKDHFFAHRVYKDMEELILICEKVLIKIHSLPETISSLTSNYFLTDYTLIKWGLTPS